MIDVLLISEMLEEKKRSRHQAKSLIEFLESQFPKGFPEHARIYHGQLANLRDVTPHQSHDAAAALAELPGPFTIVLSPGAELTFLQIVQIIMVAVTVASVIFAPEPPVATARNVQTESPNNGLSNRSNKARPNGRIPDIYGTVRSTPDQLMVPYTRFVNHVEVEDSFMCIGRGEYEILNASNGRPDVRDGTTPVHQIAGESVEIYAPFSSPGHGQPQLRIGNAINRPVLSTQRLSSVNGQVLQPSDFGGAYRRPVRFVSPNVIYSDDPGIDYTTMFLAGDSIVVAEAQQTEGTVEYQAAEGAMGIRAIGGTFGLVFPGNLTSEWATGHVITLSRVGWSWVVADGGESESRQFQSVSGIYTLSDVFLDGTATVLVLADPSVSNPIWSQLQTGLATFSFGAAHLSRAGGVVQFELNGTYTINTLTSSTMTLNDPAAVNLAWNTLEEMGGESRQLFPRIYTEGERWVDGGVLQSTEVIKGFIANIVALQGLYADNGQQQYTQVVDVVVEATPTDSAGEALPGAVPELFPAQVVGSATSRSNRAVTIEGTLGAVSKTWRFRARRLSPKNLDFVGQVVDELKWRDLWGATPVTMVDFGNVTTLQTVRLATDGALAINDPKINALVTRKLPRRISGSTFTTEKYATNDVADILSAICLDPRIGNRSPADIDFDNFYDTSAEIKAYFGFPEAAEFSYTLDNDNLSSEETIHMVAAAAFCTAYRRGRVIRLAFEKETEDSSILFNHRNKVPGSDSIRVDWGSAKSNDGIEYQYVDPEDDALVTIYIPEDRSAINPEVIESIGVRVTKQATVHAWRAYNKMLYQYATAMFDALPEANLLTLTERFLSTDNTQAGAQDGQVEDIEGLEITLSQAISLDPGKPYAIWLQNDDKVVESIPVTAGRSAQHAILARAPRRPLVTGDRNYANTTYAIYEVGGARQALPFLLTAKERPNDDTTIPLTAINYDKRYYDNDRMFAV